MIGGYPYFRKHPYIDPFLSNLMDNAEAKVSSLVQVELSVVFWWMVFGCFVLEKFNTQKRKTPRIQGTDTFTYMNGWCVW